MAQRGKGLSAEDRELIRGLSRAEKREFFSLGKRGKRKFLRELRSDRPSKQEKESNNKPRGKTTSPTVNLESLDGYVSPDEISADVRMMVGKTKGVDKNVAVLKQKARGGIETGLQAKFIDGANCPEIDSEQWAIDYSHKRPFPAIHKGVDIPQPRGAPILAISDGQVIGKFHNRRNRKGIEIMLRHSPEQTGLPFWTYSQYTHLLAMSPLEIGTKVKMGQEVGKTSNTGKMGRRIRRNALHFAIIYSKTGEWSKEVRFILPKESFWMDPNAFYRKKEPYDSKSLAKLDNDQKKIPVPYMKPDGTFVPVNTKRIWPYPCE